MFGSKLRSWMENHIVRPRKKANKNNNKNATSNVASSSSSGIGSHEALRKSDARGFTIYHGNGTTTTTTSFAPGSVPCGPPGAHPNGCSSVISSPVRRREVSPIQNHTQSRYGWQSPDQDAIMSPKSDNFLYAPQHHRVRAGTPSGAVDGRGASQQQQQQQQQADCSSSSFSSLSWSTGSKEPSMQSTSHSHSHSHSNNNNGKYAKTLPSGEAMQRQASPPSSSLDASPESLVEMRVSEEDPDAVHYEEIRTLIRRPPAHRPHHASNNNNNNNGGDPFDYERPKSEQLQSSSFSPARSFAELRGGDDASARYGRLLPSKMPPPPLLTSSADSLNANHLHGEFPPHHNSNNRSSSNNNQAPSTATFNVRGGAAVLASRSKLRTVRYPGAAPVASASASASAPLHALSSPESAYSTGYSTDGTSPGGGIYTPPEYYINMRTGTHYFPKSVNSLAVEAQRYRFGLNKIEEMSPQEPLPNSPFGGAAAAHFRRADALEAGAPGFGVPDPELCRGQMKLLEPQRPPMAVGCHSPLSIRNTIVLPTLKGFESPSPRQRCRIRTNPWYSTTDTSSSGATVVGAATSLQQPYAAVSTTSSSKSSASSAQKMELDGGSSTCSSSGRKSGSEPDGGDKLNGKAPYDSESSSSLTEVENVQRTFTPNTVRRKRAELPVAAAVNVAVAAPFQEPPPSDDDATLNEMMGKFDESYVYEKETDILSSDSDPTDCPSDLDTGQDAGDECDTDELLDIDFIDTASIQEVCDRRDSLRNLGSCSYHSQSQSHSQSPSRAPRPPPLEGRGSVRSRRNSRGQWEPAPPGGGSQRRRKRFLKTRKKSSEGRGGGSPVRSSRESRSVGGTPVCLRRNQAAAKGRAPPTAVLRSRSSSLVFTDVRCGGGRCVAIAESEKALLEADLEADVKYRQLIHEAESILVSMKSSVLSIPRDTPVASPRRVNPLANKRVEMLKHCEPDAKRELLKQQQQQRSQDAAEQEFVAGVNRRIEMLRSDSAASASASASAPNSPRFSRFSPRKTHLTNFINQNAPPEVPLRKAEAALQPPQSPQLQLNGRRLRSPAASPLCRRRFRSQSPRTTPALGESDSDAESSAAAGPRQPGRASPQRLGSSENVAARAHYLPEIARIVLYDEADHAPAAPLAPTPFSAVGSYCPQSEPLKRKVYKGSSSFERLKKSFDLESEIPKQALLAKINNLRRERQSSVTKLSASARSSSHDLNQAAALPGHEPGNDDDASVASNLSSKKQLILSTIEDLKRSLENQSVELNGLNED